MEQNLGDAGWEMFFSQNSTKTMETYGSGTRKAVDAQVIKMTCPIPTPAAPILHSFPPYSFQRVANQPVFRLGGRGLLISLL